MVFEGILVDLLNRFLGSYVKNLDASQLKVGIFGGDVILERLDLKENALDELNLPVRIFGGHLDKLRLKIPWSNLYGAPVVAEVDGLFVVAGPASAAKYDAERDAREKKDNKDRELKKIEDARKKTLETKDKKDQAPGFVDKLVTQIIRNVQVTVRNIHVTFEDGVTDPSHPFSVGVTLDSLVVQSTDSNYVIGGQDVDPVSQLIYKLVHMSCLSLYWNTDARLLLDGKLPSNWAETLNSRIARSRDTPSDMQFLLHPISAKAKLQLTMKPGVDEATPQALVNVVLEHIAISLGKHQYRNVISLVESFDRMSINQKYLKYKPPVDVSEDLRAWWRYAISAVLEEDVKRKTRMWSWKHIKEHRARCRSYREQYVEKLLAKKVSDQLERDLDELEAGLDVVNIILCRQLAESKADRQLAAREAKSGGGGWWGWTTSWVAGSPDQEPIITQPPTDLELANEKEKLYKALGYSESGGKADYSKEYVAHKVVVDLRKVSLQLYNPHGAVSELFADRVGVAFMQRPASGNISVTASLGSLTMNGRGQEGGEPPTIIQTNQQTAGSLLDVRFELKPLGKKADYSIMAKLKPVQIIYDADTIDDIIGMFLLPKDVQFQKLSAAASSTLEEAKTQGRAGLEHSIGQKKVMEMDISLHSPYLIVPQNGALTNSSTVLLVDLGSLQVTSAPQQLDSIRNATREQLEAAFYDDFDIQLRNVQVIVAGVGDDWEGARRDISSPLHILTPTMLDLQVKNSLMDDAKLPKIKVSGSLPKLKLSLSDKKINQVLKIIQSLPLPPPSLASKPETSKYSYEPSVRFRVNTEDLLSTIPTPVLPTTTEGDSSDDDVWYTAEEGSFDESTGSYVCSAKEEDASKKTTISANKLDLTFSIPEIKINFSEHDEQSHKDTSRLDLTVTSVSTSVQHRTWDTGVTASIGSLTVNDHYKRGVARTESHHMLSTVASEETEKKAFLFVKYNKADSIGPRFQSLFASTQQNIDVSLSLLRLQLHRESLINLLAIAQGITDQIKSKANMKDKLFSPSGTQLLTKSQTKIDETTAAVSKPVARVPGEKDLDLAAKLTGIELIISDDNGNLLTSNIKGVETSVVIEEKAINISASLSDVCLVDADPGSCHPNVIVKMDKSEKVISTDVVVYKNAPKTDLNTANLSVRAKVQRLKVTVLFRFLNKIKGFVSEFLIQLKLDQKTIDSAKEAAAKTATRTAEALREQSSSRVRLDVTVFAPVLVLPLSALSQAAFIADLGRLKVRNNFLYADGVYEGTEDFDKGSFVSASGEKALLDKMEVSLSSIQLGRVELLKEETKPSPGYMIVEPLEFKGVVTRSLSSWCTAVPAVDVQANLQTLKLRFSPEDYHVTMSLLSSLNEGASTGPPPISPKEKDTQSEPEKPVDPQPTEEVGVTEGGVNIRVAAVVGTVELALHTKGDTVATVRVEDLVTDVELLSNIIQVKVGISDVNVSDLSSLNPDHLHPKIVSVTGTTKALEAQIGVYPQATKSLEGYLDTNQCDVSVEASVGQLRLVLLFLFVSKITNFLKELQLSQEAIDRAKRSAQESATAAINAVQEQQASGQRIKLSITLKAPEIVVPLHSNSGEVIVADFGVLRLSNSFHLVRGWSGGERPPLYEEYDIQLKDLQVYRTLVGVANDPPRSPVLEPFNLSLVMKRNLSTSWYTDMPTIDLDASLGNLKMSASDADIEALCQVLTGNLRESLDYTPTTPTKNEAPADAVEGSSLQKPSEGGKRRASVESESTKTVSTVFKMLVLKATLKSIEIELFKIQKDSDKWAKDSHNSLASLDLHHFSSTVCIESNGAMGVAVEMLNASLDDSRSLPNKNLIRLIEKVMEDEGSTVPLVSISFNKSLNGDSSVDCTVESAKVLVDVVFIFLLLDYLMTSVSSLSKPTETSTVEIPPSPLISDATFNETIDSVYQESNKSPTPEPIVEPIVEATKKISDDKPPGKFSVKVKVLRPLIALLKNSEHKNSRALVLGSTVDFSMELGPTGLTLKTKISELAIFATRVSNLFNRATKVLEVKNSKPIKFGMQQSTSEGTAIDVEVPDVVLSFSPTTVRLILHVVKALPVTDKNSDVKIGETSPLDLWETRPVDSNSWYLNPPAPKRKSINVEGTSVDQAMPLGEVFKANEKLSLVIDSLLVLVEEETVVGGSPFPVISMKMGNYTQCDTKAMQLTVMNWSTELYVESTVSLEVSYFNLGHNVWEPLLEPSVDPSYENQELYLPWTLKASICKELSASAAKGHSRSSSWSSRAGSKKSLSSASIVKQDELPPEVSVEIVSETPLLLTLTKSCLMLFKDLWTAYGEEEQEVTEDVDSMAPEAMEAVFVIMNELGLNYPLTVNTRDTLKVHGAYSCTVRHRQSVPLHPVTEALQLKPGEYLPREVYKKRRVHIVTIAIQSFKPIDVALGTSECVYYPLILSDQSSSKKAKDSPQFGVVIDIQMSQRVPKVRIRSPLQVVNNLTEEIQVFWQKDSSEPLPHTPLTTLSGGSTHSLPLETTGSPAGGFHLNPVSSGAVPSKHSISWISKEKSFDLGCYSSSRDIQGSQPFFMHVVINEERYSRQPSINIASRAHHSFVLNYPLVLQNLLPLSVTVTENTDSNVSKELLPGSKTNYSHVALSEEPRFHTKIDYNGRIWSGDVRLDKESNEYTQLTLKPEHSVDKEDDKDEHDNEASCLKLMIHIQEMGSWQLTLYCPYWIVNKTGLILEYAGKSTDVVTVHNPQLPMALFPYKEVKVRVRESSQQNSDWSKAFSLDAAGSEGIFRCLDKMSKREYQMGTTVTTSSVGLSKVITFSPLFMTFNQTRDEISFKVGEDLNIYTVQSKQLLVFWPKSNSEEQMTLSVNDHKMSNPSKAFKFTENASRLIQTNNLIPAVVTEIQVTGSANVVTFSPYYEGVVPVKIVNSMAYDMEFQQTAEYVKGTQTVPAGNSVFYSWRVPSAQKKVISWRLVYPAQRLKMKSITTKDDGGKFKIPSKLLPHSESTTSLSSLPGDTRGSVSDWEESIDFQEWEELGADVEDGNLSGIEEDEEEEEGEDYLGEDLTDFSVKQSLGMIGRGFTSTKKLFQRRSKSKHKTVGYWVSFLDGLQRVILFTTSHEVWSHVMGGQKTERASTEVTLSLREVGLSLVNDERGVEVAYIGIRPSKPIWEILKRWNRWKPVSNHLRTQLELIIEKPREEIEGKVIPVPESNYKIDFSAELSWVLVEKNNTRIHVRRSHFEGVSVKVTLSEHLTSIEAKINEIQIDNHLLFTSNPIILYAYPTPPTIASKYEPKPFIESSVILRNSAQSNVKQVQLFQVLIQEIGLNVDMNFILAIADILANLPSGVTEVEGIERDVSFSKLPLEKSKVEQVSAAATRNYFKFLHLSPLAIHLSFYLDKDASYKPDEHKDSSSTSVFGAVLNAFTQFAFLVGRTKDAELQLGYFELEEAALTRTALVSRIQKHYTQQAVLQLYSVVLGLEVLGNPVGFVKGLKDGTINLFYHPIQGAVLGPGEFFEGLALGGREFFSSTVGGLSGALGKVSGAIGDIAAKMTGDDEFQEDRRRSDTWGQSLEGAAKGFVSGLTGVITQPYKGAKKGGAWGAIKGLSKGVIGVVLRPTAGILDLTSATFNAVQKKSKAGDSTVAEIRAARYIGPERIVFPYSPRRSTGYALFVDIDNGRLLKTDTYFDHVELVDDPLKVLLITSRQLAVVKMSSIRGRFDDDYTVDFTEFTGPARIDEKHNTVVVMPVREETFGFRFISGKKNYKEFDKTLTVLNEGIAKKSVELINQAYEEFRATAAIDY